MISIQASVSKGWIYKERGIEYTREYYFDPVFRRDNDRDIAALLDQRFPGYRIHNLESNLVSLEHYSPDLLYVGGIQPNLILGMLLGADFIPYPDQDADISETVLKDLVRIEDLPSSASLIEMELIKEWSSQVRELSSHERGNVIPPFFWDRSFRATIHGFITTALKFFGQDFFFKTMDDPGFVHGFYNWYEDAMTLLIHHFASLVDAVPSSLHIGECSGTMMGGADFETFLKPCLKSIAKKIAPLRLHFCGNCDHLLASLARTEGIGSLDTGSGTSVAKIREAMGGEFPLDLMPPVELLLKGGDPGAVREWLENLLMENAGGPLTINYHLEPGYDVENHLILHEYLYEKGLVNRGRR